LNKEKTSEIVELSLERVIPDYLAYKESKLRAKSVKRDSASLNQLCEFVGYSKPVAELTYLDIEGSKGLIQHLLSKGYRNNGINVTLRHLKAFFTWLHKKEQVLDKTIEFDMLPKGEQEYYIDEYQIQAIHNYIDDDSNGIDSFFKRCFIFYEFTGVRALEPFIGEMYGDWLYVDASKSKGKNLRKIHLSKDLKAILMEMHAFRDEYVAMDSTEPNERACERISKTLLKIRRAINFNTNRKITLKSFRHHYGITRVYTTGNIFQVAMEMGHKNVTTTQEYLRFQADEIKDHFPSLIPIIENMENMQKNAIRGTKIRGTIYSNDNKLPSSFGGLSSRLP
jgi:integrase